MTIASPTICGPTFHESYAFFSPEARRLQTHAVVRASPPISRGEVLVKTIEMRQQPFGTWLRQLGRIGALPENWDSYGAAVITAEALRMAVSLLEDLSFQGLASSYVPFHIAPDPVGGIQIEWRRADGGGSLELSIDPKGSIDVLIDRPFSEPRIVECRVAGLSAAVKEIKSFVA